MDKPLPICEGCYWNEDVSRCMPIQIEKDIACTACRRAYESREGWVSVWAMLPAFMQPVLICSVTNPFGVEQINWDIGLPDCAAATHWMPLPNPPEVKP